MSHPLQDFLSIAERAARRGGEVLLDWRGRFKTREKGLNDLVTDADLASQEVIRETLLTAFPDHDFLGEEGPATPLEGRGAEFRWLVDPLDGTANYVHQLQTFAVSIALESRGKLLVGVVFDPVSGECYTAASGAGAKLNGVALRTSDCRTIAQAMVAVSFSNSVPQNSIEIYRFLETLYTCQSVRRLGSAALNLAYIAAGRLDSYFATSVKVWDVAAGVLIIREAGGVVTALDGTELDLYHPEFLASAGEALHGEMRSVLRDAELKHQLGLGPLPK